MSKAILIVDMPESCKDCELLWRGRYSVFCPVELSCNTKDVYDYVEVSTKPDWCPLRPMPEKYDTDNTPYNLDYNEDYERGYNSCVDEILGNDDV